jgi:hypothetical protein
MTSSDHHIPISSTSSTSISGHVGYSNASCYSFSHLLPFIYHLVVRYPILLVLQILIIEVSFVFV